ncbi:uncharacterized protein L3040_000024 [Drepanopeziza brunnea f. sp. 'multigermtubi']|uniref:Uncharacterized protein n=1 Tax=Marssonina brunnea f. sp. multigermtubi (strain MB_m1) TaxID=1072389 RepID=K1WQ16_MARBU|nr:uncharacterized protein MBM_07218 [Drepanopeziza brunnea f. sp. 'multigermtubi' MB_m1]EKD14497.1 hypothetical protein MBM_07218 [Drepanopeziza brunnea f. sp. 'multigermtubi' MB_m1]KAJ5053733.1 hypothetical protein L3040_000024 [Drepanopeziza brunnea f. sp. 'multigermtubi']
MIVRPGRTPHICLRCQRGLAKRSIAVARVAFQSTDSHVQTTNEYDARDDQGDDAGLDIHRPKEPGSREPSRLHGYRGLKKQEFKETLKHNSLGDTAKVIVLRDSIVNWYELDSKHLEPQEAAHIDILGQLAEERGLAGWAEVEKNIDEFRPASERQTWDEINELVQALQEGFTSGQLQKYIENFKGRREPEAPERPWTTIRTDARILQVTPWLPGVSEIQDHFDNDPLRGYFLESHTAKQRLTLRLLRECWMLELPELVDGIGQFEIQVSYEDLDLLLLGNPSVLSEIHAAILHGEGEKLEAFRSRNVIRVTCPHVKKPFVVRDLDDALKRSRTATLSLASLIPVGPKKPTQRQVDRWIQKHFDATTLQSLSRLTNTSIVQGPSGTLKISCIDKTPNAVVSNVDVVRRLLLVSGENSSRNKHELARDTTSTKKGGFVDTPVANALPWREQQRDWGRWTAPTGKEKQEPSRTPVAEPIIKPTGKKGQSKAEAKAAIKMQNSTDPISETCWDHNYFTDTSAVLGKVLHSSLESSDSPPPLSLGGPNQIQTFVTQVSNFSRLVNDAHVLNQGDRVSSLVLRFLPDPFHVITSRVKYGKAKLYKHRPIGANALTAFPAIEMRFTIDGVSKKAALKNIVAIVKESKTDVMLPHNNIDVRFQQRTTSQLQHESQYHDYVDPILDYIKKCSLSFEGSEMLQIPPAVTLPIAKHLTRGGGFEILQKADIDNTKSKKKTDEHVRGVEYLFAGLEVRHSIAFNYQDWRLLYTSIEAGKAGGRRAELKLRPILGGKVADEAQFVDMAYQIAHIVGEQGEGTGGVKAQIRPVVDKNVARRVMGDGLELHQSGVSENYVRRVVDNRLESQKSTGWEEAGGMRDKGEVEVDAVKEGEQEGRTADGTQISDSLEINTDGEKQQTVLEDQSKEVEDDLSRIEDVRY